MGKKAQQGSKEAVGKAVNCSVIRLQNLLTHCSSDTEEETERISCITNPFLLLNPQPLGVREKQWIQSNLMQNLKTILLGTLHSLQVRRSISFLRFYLPLYLLSMAMSARGKDVLEPVWCPLISLSLKWASCCFDS